MNVFSTSDYREAIKEILKERKRLGTAMTLEKLAKSAGTQKAHISNVLSGRANFQPDQLFMIANALKLATEESKYLMLLLEHERSALDIRKRAIDIEIEALQIKNNQTEEHLKFSGLNEPEVNSLLAEYYLDPFYQLVHIALSIDRFSNNPKALKESFGLSEERLSTILHNLERAGIVEKKNGRYVNKRKNLHLKRASPLYSAWRSQLQQLGRTKTVQTSSDSSYGFSVVFSADEPTRKRMLGKILELIKSFESDVAAAPAKNVYQFAIDLFPWT